MARRPFNPVDAAGAPTPGGSPARRERNFAHIGEAAQLTVSQVSELIKQTLETRIASPLRVVGEISNLNVRQHWYFSLKDENAVISCVAWASSAKKFGFTPADGQEVVATGHISHFGPQGRTQLYVSKIEPIGAGALELRFRALCEELRGLGYFDEAHKRSLPILPRKIAVITSRTGAAIQDVIATAKARCPAVGIVLIDVRVQGEGAAKEIARAIRLIDRDHERLGIDAVLVTRGGGSIEDLWAFNERIVADAVFRRSIPLVAAIGHESDTTIIELVADRRAATPTQAAMLLVPDRAALVRQLDHQSQRLVALLKRRLERDRARWQTASRHELFRAPARLVREKRERTEQADHTLRRALEQRVHQANLRLERAARRLADLRPAEQAGEVRAQLAVMEDRLQRALIRRAKRSEDLDRLHTRLATAVHRHLRHTRERTEWLANRLAGVDVHAVLRRGFTYTITPEGGVLRSVGEVESGDVITTHVADGRIESVVGGRQPRAARKESGRGKRSKSARNGSDQLDLFSGSE